MSFRRALLYGRQMILPILSVYALVVGCRVKFADAAAVEKELALVEILLVAGKFVETDERHLHHSMPRRHLHTALFEDVAHVVRRLDGTVEEFVFACCLIVSDGTFDEFSHIERLVG